MDGLNVTQNVKTKCAAGTLFFRGLKRRTTHRPHRPPLPPLLAVMFAAYVCIARRKREIADVCRAATSFDCISLASSVTPLARSSVQTGESENHSHVERSHGRRSRGSMSIKVVLRKKSDTGF